MYVCLKIPSNDDQQEPKNTTKIQGNSKSLQPVTYSPTVWVKNCIMSRFSIFFKQKRLRCFIQTADHNLKSIRVDPIQATCWIRTGAKINCKNVPGRTFWTTLAILSKFLITPTWYSLLKPCKSWAFVKMQNSHYILCSTLKITKISYLLIFLFAQFAYE